LIFRHLLTTSIHASKARDENTFLTNKETANFGRLSM
jgi:hypothetical protein